MKLIAEALFQPIISRTEILKLPLPKNRKQIHIAIHRNHSFELVGSVLNVFLAQTGLEAHLWYSSYDDSFSFAEEIPPADVQILWVDGKRYATNPNDLIIERARRLKKLTAKPVLICCFGQEIELPNEHGIYLCDLNATLAPLGDSKEDLCLQNLSGTRLSNLACLESARAFGMRWLPRLFFPSLKAIALDCDNTLYTGILAEDGPKNILPHLELQNYLLTLKQQGIMLTIVSKNEEIDVQELFSVRQDFPLRWSDFAATSINWDNKANNICKLAKCLNIW